MLNNPHFYHRSIRKVVVTFGTLFNDIELIRFASDGTAKERFKVPLSYGSKEKYLTRITSDPTLTKSIAVNIPKISFVLDGLSYDASRKQITTLRNFGVNGVDLNTQFVPVPFDYMFSLSIFVRNTEDGAQILEQILPFFTPDFTPTVNFIPEMNQVYDVPIILNSVTSNVDYEGDIQGTNRLITWELSFTAKGYIWPPTKTLGTGGGLIRQVNVNVTQNTSANVNTMEYTLTPDPITANPEDNFGFTETITEYFK